MRNKMLVLILITLLAGCATTPIFDISQVEFSLTPGEVIAKPDFSMNRIVLWGGTILDTRNLKDSTQIEVLAYPLSSSRRPMLDKKPLGRFIIHRQGYVESATYAQGRLLTVKGTVGESQSGKIGESTYIYPVINAQQLQLWSPEKDRVRTNFGFGIGIRM